MASRSALVTVLFTDIAGSTEIADELGNRRWRELLSRHHRIIRRELRRFGGREIDTAGDGFFATFDRPTQAVRCAAAACEAVRELGIELRAGVHVGEIEQSRGGVSGVAVHLGARIGAAAVPGEVLVSDTVRQLTRGSGIVLEDRGVHALKGVPESQALFSVAEIDGERLPPPLEREEALARRGAVEPRTRPRRRNAFIGAAAALVVVATVAVLVLVRDTGPAEAPATGPTVGALVRIDPERGQAVETFPGLPSTYEGGGAPQIAAAEGGVWVLGAGGLRHLDPESGDITPVAGTVRSHRLALGHHQAWLTVDSPDRVLGVAPGSLAVTDEIRLTSPDAVLYALHVAVTDDAVWVAAERTVTRVDPATGETRTFEAPVPIEGLVGSGDHLWITNVLGNQLIRFDTETNRVAETVDLGNTTPDDVEVGEAGELWILDEFAQTVTRLSPGGELGRPIPAGPDPVALAFGEGSLWVAGLADGTVRRIDPAFQEVVETIQVGGPAAAVDVDDETGDVWVYLVAP